MITSVIMCVYNGAKYIAKQLLSISEQTRKVDKLIIYDDRSTDDTLAICEEFIESRHLDNWLVKVNKENVGWKKNFYNAICESDSEIVFFADQDDIWELDKIEVMSRTIENNSEILKLNSHFSCIDKDDNAIDSALGEKCNGSLVVTQESFSTNFTPNWKNRIGCASAITAKACEYIRQIPFSELFSHDMVVENFLSSIGASYIIDYSSIKYRLHDNNVTNTLKPDCTVTKNMERLIYLEQILVPYRDKISEKDWKLMEKNKTYSIKRNKVFTKFAPLTFFSLLGYLPCYKKHFKGWLADLMDILHLRPLFVKLHLAQK